MYKFVYERDLGEVEGIVSEIVHKVDDTVTYEDLLESFEMFVRGCGFILGNKRFVVDEDYEDDDLDMTDEEYVENLNNKEFLKRDVEDFYMHTHPGLEAKINLDKDHVIVDTKEFRGIVK